MLPSGSGGRRQGWTTWTRWTVLSFQVSISLPTAMFWGDRELWGFFNILLKAYSTCIRCRSTYWLAVTKLTMAELTHKSHQELRRGWKGSQNESQFENVSQNDRLPPLSDIEVHLCKTWQFYDFFNTKKEMGIKLIQHQNIQNWKRLFSQCI